MAHTSACVLWRWRGAACLFLAEVRVREIVRDCVYPIAAGEPLPAGRTRANTGARWTGEFRVPLFGEWFLSGALVEAYAAGPGMRTEHHIARVVSGRMRMEWDA